MITYQRESYRDVIEELKPFYPLHFAELASDPSIPLNPDYDTYNRLADAGIIHVVTVRNDSNLIGYHIAMVYPHLHYAQSLTAHTDIYYIAKPYRKGYTGIRLFKFVEDDLKSFGVGRIYTSTKTDSDKGIIFNRLGYSKKEVVYTKVLKG